MKKFFILMLMIGSLLLGGGCGAASQGAFSSQSPTAPSGESPEAENPPGPSREDADPSYPLLRCLYYDGQVEKGIADPCRYEISGRLAAGMVPHHLLASDMIAGFFELAARQEEPVDRVLIVSPSHFPENCTGDLITARAGWETPYGKVAPDEEMIRAILEDPAAAAVKEPEALEADHGGAGLIPFIKYYLPNARVTVCLLANTLSTRQLEAFQAVVLEQMEKERILVVASADCSHYLTPEEAALRDAETAQAIETMDFPRIFSFGDGNVDSPQSVSTFLRAAEALGTEPVQLDHASSPDKLPHAPSHPRYQDGITTYSVYAAVLPETDSPPEEGLPAPIS